VDPARQSLLTDGVRLAGEDRCPEALQLGTERAGVWRPVGFNRNLRFARYAPGGSFRKHIDAMYVNSDPPFLWTEQGVKNCAKYGFAAAPTAGAEVCDAQRQALRNVGLDEFALIDVGDLCRAAEQTIFSCLFYLNDVSGGATEFMKIPCRFRDFRTISVPANAAVQPDDDEFLEAVNPRKGSACLFFQPGLVHDGATVTSGQKYFLRSDLVFRRDA